MPHAAGKPRNRRFPSKKTLAGASLCVILFVAVSRGELYVIADLPYGGGWSSRILLTNPGTAAARVELKFFSKDGQPLAAPLRTGERRETQQLEIGPSALKALEIDDGDHESELQPAWATVETSGPLQILSFFDSSSRVRYQPLAEERLAAVGPPGEPPGKPGCIPPSVPGTTPKVRAQITTAGGAMSLPRGRGFQVPVSIYGSKGFNARFAFANPNETTATVRIMLLRAEGDEKVSRVVQIAPYAQLSGLLTDTPFFERELEPSAQFDGSVMVCSDIPIGILALGLEGNLAFTLPVANVNRCPGELIRPEDQKK